MDFSTLFGHNAFSNSLIFHQEQQALCFERSHLCKDLVSLHILFIHFHFLQEFAKMSMHTQVEKFTGEGFHSWATQMRYLLMNKRIWKIVNEDIPNTKSDEWKDKDEQALSLIGLHIGTNLIHHIDTKVYAKDAWDELNLIFGAKGKNQEIHLKIEFYGLQMKFHESLAQFVSKMRSIMTQLNGIKAPVGNNDAIAILLKSMPQEYDALKTTLKNLPNPTFEGCIASLLEQERELKQGATMAQSHAHTYGEQALFSKTNMSCYHCGRKGHLQHECRLKDRPKCNHCKKIGHKEEDCRFKKQEANYAEATSTNDNDTLF